MNAGNGFRDNRLGGVILENVGKCTKRANGCVWRWRFIVDHSLQ